MAIFNSYVKLPEGIWQIYQWYMANIPMMYFIYRCLIDFYKYIYDIWYVLSLYCIHNQAHTLSEYEISFRIWSLTMVHNISIAYTRSHIYIYNLYICIRRPATPQQWEMLALYHLYTNPSDRGSKLHPGYTLHSNLFGGWQCILGGDFNYVVFSIQEIWLAFRMSESKPAVLIWAWPHNRCTKYSILYVRVCVYIYII